MTDFDGEKFKIYVRLLATRKNLVHVNRMAKCGVTVRQTPHVFSDSPGTTQDIVFQASMLQSLTIFSIAIMNKIVLMMGLSPKRRTLISSVRSAIYTISFVLL